MHVTQRCLLLSSQAREEPDVLSLSRPPQIPTAIKSSRFQMQTNAIIEDREALEHLVDR